MVQCRKPSEIVILIGLYTFYMLHTEYFTAKQPRNPPPYQAYPMFHLQGPFGQYAESKWCCFDGSLASPCSNTRTGVDPFVPADERLSIADEESTSPETGFFHLFPTVGHLCMSCPLSYDVYNIGLRVKVILSQDLPSHQACAKSPFPRL